MATFSLIFGFLVLKFDNESEESQSEEDSSFSLGRYWGFWVSIFLMQVGFGGYYNSLQSMSWSMESIKYSELNGGHFPGVMLLVENLYWLP